MARCTVCNSRYQQTQYNKTDKCESCLVYDYSEEDQLEINNLVNPSGKTQAVFYDDLNDDSHGF